MRGCFKRAFARAAWKALVNNVLPYRMDFAESKETLRKAWLMWELGEGYMEVIGQKDKPWVTLCVSVENVLLCVTIDLALEKIKVSATNGFTMTKNQSFDLGGQELDALLNACRWLHGVSFKALSGVKYHYNNNQRFV